MMTLFDTITMMTMGPDGRALDRVHALGADAAARLTKSRIESRMAWLDEQDATFRALVHEIGLNAACKKDGRRPPT